MVLPCITFHPIIRSITKACQGLLFGVPKSAVEELLLTFATSFLDFSVWILLKRCLVAAARMKRLLFPCARRQSTFDWRSQRKVSEDSGCEKEPPILGQFHLFAKKTDGQ
jgi:hypothetical protein